MYPSWWKDTITVYRKSVTQDERGKTKFGWNAAEVVNNCFYQCVKTDEMRSKDLVNVNEPFARIPYPFNISKGDIVVLGNTNDDAFKNDVETLGLKEALIKHFADKHFVIRCVKENTSTRSLKHIYVSG